MQINHDDFKSIAVDIPGCMYTAYKTQDNI